MPMVARVTALERYATEGGTGMSGGVESSEGAGVVVVKEKENPMV